MVLIWERLESRKCSQKVKATQFCPKYCVLEAYRLVKLLSYFSFLKQYISDAIIYFGFAG